VAWLNASYFPELYFFVRFIQDISPKTFSTLILTFCQPIYTGEVTPGSESSYSPPLVPAAFTTWDCRLLVVSISCWPMNMSTSTDVVSHLYIDTANTYFRCTSLLIVCSLWKWLPGLHLVGHSQRHGLQRRRMFHRLHWRQWSQLSGILSGHNIYSERL